MRKSLIHLSLVTFALTACSDTTDPGTNAEAVLVILSGGDAQSGIIGQVVTIPPTVQLIDAGKRPIAGVVVTFEITAGGGTVTPSSVTTGADGNASVVWTLGPSFGNNTLTASTPGLPSVSFNAVAIAPPTGLLAFDLADPPDDTLTLGQTTGPKGIDLVGVRGDYKADSLIITATFSAPVVIATNAVNGLGGYLDIDIDDNPRTGVPYTNDFGGSASLGVEFEIDFFGQTSTTMLLYSLTRPPIPVAAAVVGNTVVVRIPFGTFGNDDGNFSFAAVFGTRERATDIVPNDGQVAVRRGAGTGTGTGSATILRSNLQSLKAPLLSPAWRRPFLQ